MPKPIKILIFTVALVLAASAGLLGYILLGVDPNDYKPQLEQLAEDNGIELTIEGDLGWSLLPKLALNVGPTKISGENYKIRPSSVAGAELSVDWLPLLRKQVVINALAIDGADIHLDQTQQAAAVLSSPLAGTDISAEESGLPFAVAFNQFSLTDSKITIHDEYDSITAYDQINLSAQKLNTLGEPFPIRLSLQLPRKEKALTGMALKEKAITEKALALSATGELAYHQLERRIDIAALDIEVANVLAELIKVSLSGTLDMAKDSITTHKLQASLSGLMVEGNLQAASLSTEPVYSGHLSMSSANLKSDLQGLTGNAIATSNPNALKLFEMQLDYVGNPSQWAVNNLQLTLDSTHITGSGKLTRGDYRDLQIRVSGDQLNLDSYRASEDPTTPPAEAPVEGSVDGDKALLAPLAALVTLLNGGTGNIQLEFGTLVTAATTFDKPKATIKLDGEKVSLSPVKLGLYQGQLDATIALDLSTQPTQISFNMTASDLNIATAQEQWTENANLQGSLAMNLQGSSRGDTAEQVRNALAGEGNLSIDNLHLASINLEQNYCELAQLVEKNPPREAPWPEGTDLHKFDSQFAVQGQTIVLKDYKTGLGNLKIRGDGTIRLDEEKFAIKVITRLEGDRTSETGCIVKSRKVRDRDIPLLCKDKFAKAGKSSCQPDPDFLREVLQKELLDKFIKPDKDGKEKPLESLLKGLLGG